MLLGEHEKRRFRELVVAYAGFSGIEVVAWCLMDNHFHLLLRVPSRVQQDPEQLPEKEVLRRLRMIYGPAELAEIRRMLDMQADAEGRRVYLGRYTRRMGDLAMFMRTVKQRFSRWYNRRNQREGTLWEDRYRSVTMEIQDDKTLGHPARIVAAYIDLNPVRAGIVEDPKDYKWSGYAMAVRGEKGSVRGITRLWGKAKGAAAALAAHRVFLFEEGTDEKTEDRRPEDARGRRGKIQDPKTGEWKARKGIDARKVWEERQRGGRLPLAVMLRLRSRYLVDGAAIGSAEFLRKLTGAAAGRAAGEAPAATGNPAGEAPAATGNPAGEVRVATGKAGVAMRFGEWGGLRVLRNLRVRVVG